MTFNITVPNAGQSPGLFPAQNNTNFQRLQEIINQEHNFLNKAPTPVESQGIHKQCTFINKTSFLSALPAGSGVLYSKADTVGASQLYWYNGSTTAQITPASFLVSGHILVPNGLASAYTIFTDPGYKYQALGFVGVYDTDDSDRFDSRINLIRFGTPSTNWISASASGVEVFFN